MLSQHASALQAPVVKIGIGIDTSRYGHYAAFLRADLTPIAAELQFVESAAGYAQLRQRFEQIVAKLGPVQFRTADATAGCYGPAMPRRVEFTRRWRLLSTIFDAERRSARTAEVGPSFPRRGIKPANRSRRRSPNCRGRW